MYEYEIVNLMTGEHSFIFGYSYEDACCRSGINPEMYDVIYFEYID